MATKDENVDKPSIVLESVEPVLDTGQFDQVWEWLDNQSEKERLSLEGGLVQDVSKEPGKQYQNNKQ